MTYTYTKLKQDGTTETLHTGKKWNYEQIRDAVGGTIELIPRDYYPKNMTGQVYGHEEGRFNPFNHRNPIMKVLKGNPALGEPAEWDCVGDLILEQTEKQYVKMTGVTPDQMVALVEQMKEDDLYD